jgi:ubiquinone/menaquinone biosynthesis C-methylase UbiE
VGNRKPSCRIEGEPVALPKALPAAVPMPGYLEETYWWAYTHPKAVRVFERQWLVNLILWGNYRKLREAAFQELPGTISGRVLQVACVYGDFTAMLARQLGPAGRVDVIDVAPVQLDNLTQKINAHPQIAVLHQDSSALGYADSTFDQVLIFFLLHEQPECVRIRTVAEAMRVVKPGGKVIFVDYHGPRRSNPFRYLMIPILKWLEPFAMDLWRREISDWLPTEITPASLVKQTYFGGLYQKVVITR